MALIQLAEVVVEMFLVQQSSLHSSREKLETVEVVTGASVAVVLVVVTEAVDVSREAALIHDIHSL